MSRNLWEAWTLASKWRVRPSELYAVEGDIMAFCFDRAVTLFGQDVENEIHDATMGLDSEAKARAAAKKVLDRRLDPRSKNSSTTGYKDPARSMSF